MPSYMPQTTKAPTARKASSLTVDSAAMVSIRPLWRSPTAIRRVPKAMANRASKTTLPADSGSTSAADGWAKGSDWPRPMASVVAMARICSAM